ncbi:MAG TPA: HAMP domain-containing sensor histidine kinase [Methylosinus sp.]|jgi:signal transduction histidine kinase
MRIAPSLATRVVCYLVVAQSVAFVIASFLQTAIGVSQTSPIETMLDEMAIFRVSDLVRRSLTRDGDGTRLRIEPIPELRAEQQRAPGLKFAAFDVLRYEAVPGSAPELTRFLAGAIKINSSHTHFLLPDDPKTTPLGYSEPARTPFGVFQIAVYGQKFRLQDLYYSIIEEFRWSVASLASTGLLTVGAAWFAVRRGLKPLRSASEQAARIDMGSLDQRLPMVGVPTEVAPLVGAVNDALSRLDAGAARLRRHTANAAHELRTPLAILRARIEDDEEPSFKSDLLRDACRLQAIVEQMLAAARLSENQLPLDQEVDLGKTVRQVVSRYVRLALEADRAIELEAARTPVSIRANQTAVECALANVVDNALRAEIAGGTVLVKVGADAVVEIIDHGDGVPPDDREKLFEPFWRKSDASPGAGLGLSITKELMDTLGGRISVEETPGGGATFRLAFRPAA